MTCATPVPSVLSSRRESPIIDVEVGNTPLPVRMRLDGVRAWAMTNVRQSRPRLPAWPATAPVVPAVGITALTMLLVRDRRRTLR